MSTAALPKIEAKERARRAAAVAAFAELARRLADDPQADVDTDACTDILRDAGKNSRDLDSLVRTLQGRQRARAFIGNAGDTEAQLKDANAECARLTEAFFEAQQVYRAQFSAARQRLENAAQLDTQVIEARAYLERTAADANPGVAQRLKAVQGDLAKARKRFADLDVLIDNMQKKAVLAAQEADYQGGRVFASGPKEEMFRQKAVNKIAGAEKLRAEFDQLRAAIAELEAQEAELKRAVCDA